MTVTDLVYSGNTLSGPLVTHEVEGHSYNPVGQVRGLDAETYVNSKNLCKMVDIMSMCNDAQVQKKGPELYTAIGAPTEAAMRVVVEKLKHYDK